MDFSTAVLNAKNGDVDSFEYLHKSTSVDMYYLALKYVKDESAARDIIDKAYVNARDNISGLKSPELFNLWLSSIVADISLEYLKINKPLIFSAVGGNENNGMSFIYDTLDNNEAFNTKRQYSNDDILFLSKELLNSLSDEQRLCIIMHHFDGQTIEDVAKCFCCTDDIVRSRLYYGRNALRDKIKLLKNKGVDISTNAPIPLLKYILAAEKGLPEIQNYFKNDNKKAIKHSKTDNSQRPPVDSQIVESSSHEQVSFNDTAEYSEIGSHGILAFLSTVTGKITAAMLVSVTIGAVVAGVAVGTKGLDGILGIDTSSSSDKYKMSSRIRKPTDTETDIADDQENVETLSWKMVADEQYSKLISGKLNKNQLEFVLARLPRDYNSENDTTDHEKYINCFCYDIMERGAEKGFTSPTWLYIAPDFKVDEINMIFSSFSSYTVTNDNFTLGEYVASESGDLIVFNPDVSNDKVNARIERAEYDSIKMNIYFYSEYYSSGINKVMKRKAFLLRDDSGYYKIKKITVEEENVDTENSLIHPEGKNASEKTEEKTSTDSMGNKASAVSSAVNTSSVNSSTSDYSSSGTSTSVSTEQSANSEESGDTQNSSLSYSESAQSGENTQSENTFSKSSETPLETNEKTINDLYNEILDQHQNLVYTTYDMDNDGVSELLIKPEVSGEGNVLFYTCVMNETGYIYIQLDSDIYIGGEDSEIQSRFEIPTDGLGMLLVENNKQSPNEESNYRLTKNDDKIIKEEVQAVSHDGESISWKSCSEKLN